MLFGFKTFSELLAATFKNVGSQIIVKYILPVILLTDTFFQFFFQSVGAIYFLIVLYVIDFITGIVKASYYSFKVRRLKKEGKPVPKEFMEKVLISKKFPRFLITMLAALLILSILKFAGIHVIIFYPLYSIFYSVFLGQQIISITENLTEMKLLPLSILNKIKMKITEYGNNR